MTWEAHYLPPNAGIWQGRQDAPLDAYFFQRMKPYNLLNSSPIMPSRLSFTLLGFSCDEGIRRNLGRVGAKKGPSAIRQMLGSIALQRSDIDCYDAGDIVCDDTHLEEAQAALATAVNLLLKEKTIPILLGGGHEMAWGHYQGIRKQNPHQQIGIVNIDAHLDMRPLLPHNKGSSGTPFLQIANDHQLKQLPFSYYCIGLQRGSNISSLINTAKEYHAHLLWIDDLQQMNATAIKEWVQKIINDNDHIYLSVCLDVLAAAYAPGVSAPQAFGATPWQIIPFIREFANSGKVLSYDIAELCPILDKDNRTAKLAANFIFEMMHYHVN